MIGYYVNKIDTENGCKHLHVYKLNMPGFEDKEFYKQTNALNYFWSYKKPDRRRNGKMFYHLKRDFLWEQDNKFNMESFAISGMDPNKCDKRLLPVTECNGIWEFFDAINYDYKKKKYVENSSN